MSRSTFILTVMEGAVMQARTFRSLVPFDASVELLREYLEGLTRLEERGDKGPSSSLENR